MQRAIALVLIIAGIFTFFTIPVYGGEEEYVEIYLGDELVQIPQDMLGVEFYINNPNNDPSKSRLRINKKILQNDGY